MSSWRPCLSIRRFPHDRQAPLPDQSPITRPPASRPRRPPRRARVGHLVGLEPLGPHVFRELDYGLWRSSAHNPVRMLRLVSAERLEQAARDPIFLNRYDQAIKALDRARSGEGRLVDAAQRPRPDARHRLLLGRVRAAPVAADLRRRPRRAGRRPLQGSQRPRACRSSASASCIRRATSTRSVSADGWQEERYERLGWDDAPIELLRRRPGKPCVIAVPLGHRTVLVSVWHVKLGRTHLYLLDTDLEENAPVGSRAVGPPLRRRSGDPRPAGDHPGHRRRSRAAPSARSRGVAPERRPRRLRGAAAHPRVPRSGAVVRGRAGGGPPSTVFTTHTPVPAGHDAFPFHLVETHLAGCWGSSATRDGVPRARPPRQRPRHAVQHDGARPARELRQRRQPAARRGHPRDVGAVLAGKPVDEVPVSAITNGVHLPTWVSPTWHALRRSTSAPTGASARRSGGLGRDPRHPDDELWKARASCAGSCSRSCASAPASAGRTSASAPPRVVARHAARSGRADDRLRAPLRHLQARPS